MILCCSSFFFFFLHSAALTGAEGTNPCLWTVGASSCILQVYQVTSCVECFCHRTETTFFLRVGISHVSPESSTEGTECDNFCAIFWLKRYLVTRQPPRLYTWTQHLALWTTLKWPQDDLTPIFLQKTLGENENDYEFIWICGVSVLETDVLWIEKYIYIFYRHFSLFYLVKHRTSSVGSKIKTFFFLMPGTRSTFECKNSQFHTLNVFANCWKVHRVLD